MSRRKNRSAKRTRHDDADPPPPEPNPPRPNKALLLGSIALLVAWIAFLLLVALQS